MARGTRWAIKIGPDQYSDGPRQRPVPLNKAKLWTNIGHLKNHLNGVSGEYPNGSTVVEVEVVYHENSIGLVSEFLEAAEKRDKARKDEQKAIHARMELESAERRLKEAKETARRLGVA